MRNILKILLVISLMAFLFSFYRKDFISAVEGMSIELLPDLFVVFGGYVFLVLAYGLRQYVLLTPLSREVGVIPTMWLGYSCQFANNFMPASLGADICRLHYLKKCSKLSLSDIGGVLVLDRILGLIALLLVCFVSIGLAMVFDVFPESTHVALLLFFMSAIFILALCLTVLLVSKVKGTQRFRELAERRIGVRRLSNAIDSWGHYKSDRMNLLLAFLFAVCGHFAATFCVAFIAKTLMGEAYFFTSMVLAPFVILGGVVSVVPGNFGWTEALAAMVWGVFGEDGGLAVFILWRMCYLFFSLGGGVAYWVLFKRNVMASD